MCNTHFAEFALYSVIYDYLFIMSFNVLMVGKFENNNDTTIRTNMFNVMNICILIYHTCFNNHICL